MSCLFDSLSEFIGEAREHIRIKICDYLHDNKPILEGMETSYILSLDNADYIHQMRKPQTWGGAIEIQAACNIWQVRIFISIGRENTIEFLPISTPYTSTHYLIWTGNHFLFSRSD
jgi:hypothetical protein